MPQDIVLAIDVGTGSVRVALVHISGEILASVQQEHDQITPRYGWSEQSATKWWEGTKKGISQLMREYPNYKDQLLCISSCGQMHGTVLVDDNNTPVLDLVPLWNDKRNQLEVDDFLKLHDPASLLSTAANPPTVAWPAFKLQWIRRNHPKAWANASGMLMPKDFINACLTGERATDYSEASCFYLMNAQTRDYDPHLLSLLDIPRELLPRIKPASEVIGKVRSQVCQQTGLPEGLPVMAGTSDMAASILGSGVYEAGTASDSTGTSTLLTVVSSQAKPGLQINNLHLANDAWGAFTILDAGGDAMRWARKAFHNNALSYQEIADLAQAAPVGSNALLFLPYLTGERNATHKNTRAQFFGLTRSHGLGELHRSVLEGAAFGAKKCLDELTKVSGPVTKLIASGGGSRSEFVLKMKASIYDLPIIRSAEQENGLMGCAMIAGVGMGAFSGMPEAVKTCIRHDEPIYPDAEWQKIYKPMYDCFCDLYNTALPFYDRLDSLADNKAPGRHGQSSHSSGSINLT